MMPANKMVENFAVLHLHATGNKNSFVETLIAIEISFSVI
jgi:hypothetical protein